MLVVLEELLHFQKLTIADTNLFSKVSADLELSKKKKLTNGFRSAHVEWEEYRKDFDALSLLKQKRRKDFESLLKVFLEKISINADWEMVQTTNDEDF